MRKKRIIACLLCALALVTVLIGCDAKDDTQPGETTSGQGGTVEVPKPNGSGYVTVSTPYGDLYYQEQWVDHMRVEQSQNGEICKISFEAELSNGRCSLFTLEIGGGSGVHIGRLMDAQGTKRNVYATVHPIPEDMALTEEEVNRIYAMQEEINYVMEYLQ